ncbi:MAG: hypothetical protein IJE16_04115 [Ruminococcus sp.]|nr:hypothetical protein [Ruminococcus sp.]
MGQYRIAELNLEIETNSKTLQNNLKVYETSFDYMPNLSLSISDDILLQLLNECEGYSADVVECEYHSTEFARSMFDYNGFPIKATAVEYENSAVLFSAPFEETRVFDFIPAKRIFAVDCPAIRLINSVFYAYGTPFGQFGEMSRDIKLPVKSIVFVDNERFNSLKTLDTKDMVSMFMRAVHLSMHSERMKHTLYMLEKVSKCVKFYGVSDLSDVDFILERVTED